MVRDIHQLVMKLDEPIREALRCIDEGHCGIALILDHDGILLDTITDGDIRRAILAGQRLDTPIREFVSKKASFQNRPPVTAPLDTDPQELLRLMTEYSVRQIPLLDKNRRVISLAILEDVVPANSGPLQAIIMAGGQGNRLRPLTEEVPKPMLPVGGKPLMERIVQQLEKAGIRQVNITTYYKPESIIEHFGDGSKYGVELSYVNEDMPLGTGGALGLIAPPRGPLLVINGDILTQVDFRAMIAFHQEYHAEMTVAVRRYDMQVPYGVIACDGPQVRGVNEKPQMEFLVNAGIYILESSVYDLIPQGKKFNMTDLIKWLIEAKRIVISFPIREYWLDIGKPSDYLKAQDDIQNGRVNP